MKLTIFGATGRTGLQITEQAIKRGHDVTVLVRDKTKLGDLASQVTVREGSVLDRDAVAGAIAGSQAVISALGPTKDSQPGFQPQASQVIVDAMKQAGVKRLITMTGAGVRTEDDQPKFADKAIVGLMNIVAKKALADGQGHVEVVKASGLDWTVVRAPMLKDAPVTGRYGVGMVGDDTLKTSISRADIATFILDTAADTEYVHRLPLVAHPKA